MGFKSAFEFHNQSLDKLVSQIEKQKNLLCTVKNVLPEELAAHIVSCIINQKTLLVYTSAAVWASQLRFYQKAMLNAVFNDTNGLVEQIQIRLTKPNK